MALRRRLGSHSILGGVRKHRERLAERAGQMQWERTASVHMRSAMPVTADAEALKPPLGCVRSAIRKEDRFRDSPPVSLRALLRARPTSIRAAVRYADVALCTQQMSDYLGMLIMLRP